jgi:secreted PhoX family phosphatase
MAWTRRSFLRASLLGSSALAASGGLGRVLASIPAGPQRRAVGFGPLVADPDGLLDLPAGFRYRLLSTGILDSERDTDERFGSRLSDGTPTPGMHDGMAAFEGPGGLTILVRNHELDVHDGPHVGARQDRPYDPRTGGGTTTLWVDTERRQVRSFASLSGTLRNCAGGRTPWGSWFSAEETTFVPGRRHALHADPTPDVTRRHGYIFEVDSRSESLVDPVPIKAMGRFRHEAVAVDPASGYAYLSEDTVDGLFYRFRPDAVSAGTQPSALRVGDYARGGVLEALRVRDRPKMLTRNLQDPVAISVGESLPIEWVRIEEPDPDLDSDHPPRATKPLLPAPSSTRAQGFAQGCAQFARTEGIAYANGDVYLCCTNGGPKQLGQVFRIGLREQRLSLVVESSDDSLLDGPDNICMAPYGDLVVCEDNLSSGKRENYLVGVTPQGRCYRLARNAHRRKRELAGACFSPDGRTLFVNVQNPGLTFAIWGPWESRRV